jgi:hypothetical protein
MSPTDSIAEKDIVLHPHSPKTIRFIELWEEWGWRTKLYGIHGPNMEIGARLQQIAKNIAQETLPQPSIIADRYGLAFVTIHPSPMFNQIIIDWWERDNELRHRVFKANPDTPFLFQDITATGEAFCVWELRPAKYLSRRLEQVV